MQRQPRGEPAHAGYDLGTADQALSQKCGANKYGSVQGADVSEWQGNVDWSAMRHKGIEFAFARVSDGASHVDPTFSSNWKKMKAAGLLRGAYQYFEPGQSAKAQADMVVNKVGKLGSGDLPCVIDVETSGGQSASTIASKLKTWLQIVKKGTGKTPIIYTGAYFWEGSVKSKAFSGYPLWIAAYGPSCPSVPNGWGNWKMWQYCDGQKQYCKNGAGFDRNVFNGSKAELLALANGAKTLKAKAVRKWSSAQKYHGKSADYLACAGDNVKLSFTFANKGSATWRDVNGRGDSVGSDVFLVTANGKKDKITGHKRFSVSLDKNRHVRGDRKAPNCSSKSGCRKTTFVKGGMQGKAPKKPGIYASRWRLRDYSKAWGKHSKGFGPKVQLSLKVIDCDAPAQECGCRVWCSDGKSHRLSSNIQSNGSCESAAKSYCAPGNGNGALFTYRYQACGVGSGTAASPTTPFSASDAAGRAARPVRAARPLAPRERAARPTIRAPPIPRAPRARRPIRTSAAAGASGASADDVGDESDPNSYDVADTGDDSAVEDDPDFTDDGFNGDAAATDAAAGCSVVHPGRRSGAPLGGLVGLLMVVGVAEARRRARRNADAEQRRRQR